LFDRLEKVAQFSRESTVIDSFKNIPTPGLFFYKNPKVPATASKLYQNREVSNHPDYGVPRFIRKFKPSIKGGPIMWPILVTAVVAVAVLIERTVWWGVESARRRPDQVDQALGWIETGDIEAASKFAKDSKEPILRVIWHGLNHYHHSLQGALQRAAGVEAARAERFLIVLDTVVTLAPLLGLLGTVTGIMHSFNFVGNEDLAATKVSGRDRRGPDCNGCGPWHRDSDSDSVELL